MQLIELLYVVFSGTLILSGLAMAGLAIRAYVETRRQSMIFLSVGFSLIVAAAGATTISAFLTEFEDPRLLLTVNYCIMTLGFLSVIVSLTQD
ncbi:hypothetical protein OB905_02425 [Halobacteria archaeon AArc-dxtr1]|nr:hypothetical protein [Halobacteria archaeon AArc-dxtr1]